MSFDSKPLALVASLFLLLALCTPLTACNVIDVAIGRHAKVSNMVPGINPAMTKFDCWLTLEFNRYPEGVDLTDIRVRFTSIALDRPAEFDWNFIAANDVVAKGAGLGSGYKRADHTRPDEAPPLGEPIKVRFPLKARDVIENAPNTLWLKAELFWGGKKQDSAKRTIDHAYSSTPGGL